MITIALDAMGGDHAPRAEVEGAITAARELGVRVLLVGIEATVRQELARHRHRNLPLEIVAASEVVTMQDSPSHAFRRKKDSSLHVAARLVRDGRADAFVSAGNTGAVMTVARFVLGTLPSVDRPALAAAYPNMKEKVSIMLDVGANVDSKPVQIEQFAQLGVAALHVADHVERHERSLGKRDRIRARRQDCTCARRVARLRRGF